MPVCFFIDPAIVRDEDATHLPAMTLSYTFYPVAEPKKPEGHAEAAREAADEELNKRRCA